jgi:hypothetical protein
MNEASVRQTEVRELQPPVGVDDDIVRLDIPVYDSERMQVNELPDDYISRNAVLNAIYHYQNEGHGSLYPRTQY